MIRAAENSSCTPLLRVPENNSSYILRALEPDDLDILYDTENDKSLWKYSNTSSPFSKHSLKKFIENSHLDIVEHKQIRLVLSDIKNTAFGFIDLFKYDMINKRAGVGIIIFEKYRSRGLGSISLDLIENYVKKWFFLYISYYFHNFL